MLDSLGVGLFWLPPGIMIAERPFPIIPIGSILGDLGGVGVLPIMLLTLAAACCGVTVGRLPFGSMAGLVLADCCCCCCCACASSGVWFCLVMAILTKTPRTTTISKAVARKIGGFRFFITFSLWGNNDSSILVQESFALTAAEYLSKADEPTIAIDARLVGASQTGDSTYWHGLLYGLSRIEPRANFLLFTNTDPPANAPKSGKFHWTVLKSRNQRWWSMVRFPLAARKRRAAAIHTQYTLSPLAGQHGITTIHDVSFFIGPDWFKPRDRWILQRSVPASVNRAKRILAVSETSKAEIEQFIPGSLGKISVTPNACPPWTTRIDATLARRVVAEQLGISSPYLMTLGTRWPRKNMNLAVSAFRIASQTRDLRLAVVGKSGWGSESSAPGLISTGYVEDDMLGALYSGASLYLAPSFHEGFGIPVLEAFRCRCPVLCSTGGALPEVAGNAAAVETSWEPEDWARRIGLMLDDSGNLELLRERGARRERQYSWEDTARKTMNAYLDGPI